MEESIASSSNGALFNGFEDDFVDKILSEIENGTNNKSVINGNPAAKQKRECQPWLKQKPFVCQATSGHEAEQRPKLPSSSPMMMNKNRATSLYLQVMEEVANKTQIAFLDHYGGDSVHVKFQELWKLKMMNKNAEPCSVGGNFQAASVANPSHDLNPPYGRRQRKGTSAQAPSQTSRVISSQGESIQNRHLSANQDGNATHSQSTACIELGKRATSYYKQLASQPWQGNAAFQRAQLNYVVQPAAKKQRLHQPWLKQKPFG